MKKKLIILFVIPIVFSFLVIYLCEPKYNGQIKLERKDLGKITIYREKTNGIPHIYANSLKSSLYGLGFVHAQDRLWQLSFKRIAVFGRLSELLDSSLLDIDILMRNLRFKQNSINHMKKLNNEVLANLQAYSDGINDYVKSLKLLPIEFILTGIKWENWTPLDSFAITKLSTFSLGFDWYVEIIKEIFRETYGDDFAKNTLFSNDEDINFDNFTILTDEELKQSNLYKKYDEKIGEHKKLKESTKTKKSIITDQISSTLLNFGSSLKGSNSWAIHGNKTKSGKPILASDPHLDTNIPSIWHLSELNFGKDNYVIGSSIPGMPALLNGKTNYLSWGISILVGDNCDTFYETFDKTGMKYLYNNSFHELDFFQEEFKLKGQNKNHSHTFKFTRRGPVLEPFLLRKTNMSKDLNTSDAISISWGGYSIEDKTFEAFYSFYSIDSFKKEKFLEFVHNLRMPSLNIIFATRDNHIGYLGAGTWLKKKNPSDGFPTNGSLVENDYVRLITKEEYPHNFDPVKGYLVAANNAIASKNSNITYSDNIVGTSRARRISQLIKSHLDKGLKVDFDIMRKWQLDVHDNYAEKLVPMLISIFEYFIEDFTKEELNSILPLINQLKKWDFEYNIESIPATIYTILEAFYWEKCFIAINPSYRVHLQFNYVIEQFYARTLSKWAKQIKEKKSLDSMENWCKNEKLVNLKTKNRKTCAHNLLISLIETEKYLKENYGQNIKYWQWGFVHKLIYSHSIFKNIPILGKIFGRSFPAPGSRRTLNVAVPDYENNNFNGIHSANYRQIVDMDDKNGKSVFVIDMGNSENVFSKFYDDQMKLMKEGKYIQMKFNNPEILKNENVLNFN